MIKHTINAEGKKLGRIASEAAHILMGKNRTDFVRNAAPDVRVTIENTSKLEITEKKGLQKTYTRHSGYPGGQRQETLSNLVARKGQREVLRRAIKGMLPKNKLVDGMMKNLSITD